MNEIRYEPTELAQGESVKWIRQAVDYPANLWEAQYRFRALAVTGTERTWTAPRTATPSRRC